MRAIFTESLLHKTFFNMVVYGSSETHITMHNLKTLNWNQLKFWKISFFGLYLLIHAIKKMLLESVNIPLSMLRLDSKLYNNGDFFLDNKISLISQYTIMQYLFQP